MFGYECNEPISLVCPHPYARQILVCTMKNNLAIFDMVKNRSLRTFTVPTSYSQHVGKSSPIGLFFVDHITNRSIQCTLKSTILQLPADQYISLVFPRGAVMWNHTLVETQWFPFNFTASCVTQTPDSLVLGDGGSNSLSIFSLLNYEIRKFATTEGAPTSIFTSQFGSDQFGIISHSASGHIEIFSASGKVSAKCDGENAKTGVFDVFSNTLFFLRDRKTVRSYSISAQKIERISECSFNKVAVNESQSTNYIVQAICPCHLPITVDPAFFAICDQNSLLVGTSSKVVQKVANYPATENLRRLSCSVMMAHPTDMSLIILCSEKDLIILDVSSHLPQIVPSIGIPTFFQQVERFQGLFNVFTNDELTIIVNRSSESYSVYKTATNQLIATRSAIDVVLGPKNRYVDLKLSAPRKGKDVQKKAAQLTAQVYDDGAAAQSQPVCPPKDCVYPLRMISFGDFFAVIVGANKLDLSFNNQKTGKTACLVYRWDTLDPVALQLDGAAMIEFEPPYLAIASPTGYAVFDTERGIVEKVRRQQRVIHFKFFEKKLYLLTMDGLAIDNLKGVALISARFSHLLTVDKNAPFVPVNAVMIKEIQKKAVVIVDTRGNAVTIGIPQEGEDNSTPMLVRVANSKTPIAVASQLYPKVSEEEVKRMLLLLMNEMGWEAVEPYLSESERAVSELTMGTDDKDYQDDFNAFVANELEVAGNE
jgi:hypothetical protein